MRHRHAFSLVEISLVLVIIGLLVGAVLAGQSLMQAQRLRNILVGAITYATAIQQFQDKYAALPGDMPDAERVWGTASGGCPNGASVGAATCNGNGNGIIDSGTNEVFRAWQQLVAGGYITGHYNGIADPTSYAVPDVNIPLGALDNTGFFLSSWGIDANQFFPGDSNNAILFAQISPPAADTATYPYPHNSVIGGRDAQKMDEKADDGAPGTGGIRNFPSTNTHILSCSTTSDPATALYSMYSWCSLLFTNSFKAPAK